MRFAGRTVLPARFGLRITLVLFLDVNCCGRSHGDSREEHSHLSDAVFESVMVFRLAAGAVAEVVTPLGLAKAGYTGFLSGCTVVLGIGAAQFAQPKPLLQLELWIV